MARKKARAAVLQTGNKALMQGRQARQFSGGYGTHKSGNRRMGTRASVKRFEMGLSA